MKSKKSKDWYNPENLLGWSREDYINTIYDYMQNYITGYNPYNINFYCPTIMRIFTTHVEDMRNRRLGLTERDFKDNYKNWLLKELEKVKE